MIALLGGDMNKSDLIDAVAEATGLQNAKATKVVDAVIDAITSALNGGGDVRLLGFGSFSVADRAARQGRNPRTGATIEIAASKIVRFRPGKRLKEAVNG